MDFLDLPTHHRQLDHLYKGPDNGENFNARAKVDQNGKCIEYRETAAAHANRLIAQLALKPVTNEQVGIERGLFIWGCVKQLKEGNNKTKRPKFTDVLASMKWKTYEGQKGLSREVLFNKIIRTISLVFMENEKEELLENPNRPGPDYYSDCVRAHWIDETVKQHKQTLSKDEILSLYHAEHVKE